MSQATDKLLVTLRVEPKISHQHVAMLGNEIELTLVLMKDTAKVDHYSDPQEKSPMYIRV